MEERALLAIIISILIIFFYQYFFIPKDIQKNQDLPVKDSISSDITNTKEKEEKTFEENKNEEIKKYLDEKKRIGIKHIDISTDKISLKIDTLGGRIISYKIKDFFEQKRQEGWFLKREFWTNVKNAYFSIFKEKKEEKKEIVEMINNYNNLSNNFCLGFLGDNSEDINTDTNDIYILDSEKEDEKGFFKSIKLYKYSTNGIYVEKLIKIYKESYKIDICLKIKNLLSKTPINNPFFLIGPGIGKEKNINERHRYVGPVIFVNEKKERIKEKDYKKWFKRNGKIDWLAIENPFFVKAILTESVNSSCIIFKQDKDQDVLIGLRNKDIKINPGDEIVENYQIYIGPKRKEDLKDIKSSFIKLIDYGWFTFFAEIMLWLLNKIYKVIPNYGLAIIILTIFIKILFWPLTEKSFRSMEEMQKVQPLMNELKEKYKNDQTKMNKEIIELYKKQGVNPLGGCLPMLFQIPIFLALYEGLMLSIEMRGAPFMLWITDLSTMDPLLITPVLMGITMYIQQKMMPTSLDSKHASLMNGLPIIFTVFFLGFPSGLVIYWLFNNVLTIFHQYLIKSRSK